MSPFTLVQNPAHEGRKHGVLVPACHDRSRFLTIRCACGHTMHLHETQLDHAPDDAVMVTSCHGCKAQLELEVASLRAAIAAAWPSRGEDELDG